VNKSGRISVDMLLLPRSSWNSGDYRRPEGIADALTTHPNVNMVIYINTPRFPVQLHNLTGKQKETSAVNGVKRALRFNILPTKAKHNLLVFTPFIIFPRRFQFGPILRSMVNRVLALQYRFISNWLRHHSDKPRIAFVNAFRKGVLDALACLTYDLLAVDIYDDPFDDPLAKEIFRSKEEWKRAKDHYEELLKQADVVFANSEHLVSKYSKYVKSSQIYLLPSGVNLKAEQLEQVGVPADLQEIGYPRAVYTGQLNYSLDIDILVYLLEKNPKCNFVLIGKPIGETGKRLMQLEKQYPNLYLLGHKPHTLIRSYQKHADILFSFKNPHMTKGGDSLKIYEYLRTGNPIVSTKVSPAHRFNDLIYVANDKHQFDEYLKQALREDDQEKREKRKQAARDNTWEKRVDVILERVLRLL